MKPSHAAALALMGWYLRYLRSRPLDGLIRALGWRNRELTRSSIQARCASTSGRFATFDSACPPRRESTYGKSRSQQTIKRPAFPVMIRA